MSSVDELHKAQLSESIIFHAYSLSLVINLLCNANHRINECLGTLLEHHTNLAQSTSCPGCDKDFKAVHTLNSPDFDGFHRCFVEAVTRRGKQQLLQFAWEVDMPNCNNIISSCIMFNMATESKYHSTMNNLGKLVLRSIHKGSFIYQTNLNKWTEELNPMK